MSQKRKYKCQVYEIYPITLETRKNQVDTIMKYLLFYNNFWY